jgi:lipoprotein-releasing system ATP-binding protein
MFERYTEKARRVIFFARYEACEFGSSETTPEHLLLGMVREDEELIQEMTGVSPQVIRAEIVKSVPVKEKTATSIDLPLSQECKRILDYGAEEAGRLRHRHIGTKHLFLGILREDAAFAAQVLRQNGVTLEAVRDACSHAEPQVSPEEIAHLSSFPREILEQVLSQQTRGPVPRRPPVGGDEAVKIEGLTKTYPGVTEPLQILQGIDLTLYKGEIIAIVGQSGSGKSTLLHILGTIDRPTHGSVRFGDQNPFELNAEELAKFRRRSIGFVFQFHNLLPEFTALENVMMPRLIAGHRSDERMGVELLELVGLGNRLKHRPGELSGGEQQRVAIARALVNTPLLMLADEPTGALDNQTGELVFQLFQKIQREKNLTSILATHNASIASRCNRLFRLENGRLRESSQHYV